MVMMFVLAASEGEAAGLLGVPDDPDDELPQAAIAHTASAAHTDAGQPLTAVTVPMRPLDRRILGKVTSREVNLPKCQNSRQYPAPGAAGGAVVAVLMLPNIVVGWIAQW